MHLTSFKTADRLACLKIEPVILAPAFDEEVSLYLRQRIKGLVSLPFSMPSEFRFPLDPLF